ncbi:uncharacterized protein V6R79_000827 [Siganus canaliculatus]
MAESRRVQLTTLSHDVGLPPPSFEPATPKPAPHHLHEPEKCPDRAVAADTVRLVLTLFEPDERSFPEFSYSQLVDGQNARTEAQVPLSRFEEEENRENEELAAIAKKLEEKYASIIKWITGKLKCGGKPKKKDRIQDLIDIGYGYEEDSFIDNSEAYDEFVPASISTKFGGFYVNSGVLQFRQASDTEDPAEREKTFKSTKKRKLHGGRNNPKKKSCRESNRDAKSSTLSENGPHEEVKSKKKKAAGTLSVTSMLKKFQREKEKELQKVEKASQKLAAASSQPTVCPADAAGGGGPGLTDPLLTLIGSTNDHALIQAASTLDFDMDLDSLLEISEGTPQPATETQPKADERPRAQLPDTPQSQLKSPAESTQAFPQTSQCVPLPEGLPSSLKDSIQRLMLVSKTSEGESKLKFFTPEINSVLLDIEWQCQKQGSHVRSKVYTHLSSFLPCSRDTLLKRVKKLLLVNVEEPAPDTADPIHKLKEAIGRSMPDQIAHFNQSCQVYEQVKASKTEEKSEGQKTNDGPEDPVDERGGKKGGPKKSFRWTEEIRECLWHVLEGKLESQRKGKTESQELEEHLKTLLDNEVKPLWPKGWMQSRVLMRESRNVLSLFQSGQQKKGKAVKKRPVSSGGPVTLLDGCSVLQEPPLQKDVSWEAGDVCVESSEGSNWISSGAVMAAEPAVPKVEAKASVAAVDTGSPTPAGPDEPQVTSTATPTESFLDLLADQALAQVQPLALPQELLAAAVAKYKHSVQHLSFAIDTRSPPLPPPPPHSSPVGFPVTGVCKVAFPQLLQIGEFVRRVDSTEMAAASETDI